MSDDPNGDAPLTWAKADVMNKGGSSGGAPKRRGRRKSVLYSGRGPESNADGATSQYDVAPRRARAPFVRPPLLTLG